MVEYYYHIINIYIYIYSCITINVLTYYDTRHSCLKIAVHHDMLCMFVCHCILSQYTSQYQIICSNTWDDL
jgi:hypothetical protein